MDTQANNRRIARNTLMLYLRMGISVLVSLYTSRVVLSTLGVEDYGIYSLVGGIVTLFQFLNSSMSGATSRFLTFELGKGDFEKLKKTFCSAVEIHVGIAIVIFILAETIGLWFLCTQLNIPSSRMTAAHWVYQCSILVTIIQVIQVPFNASIISHERMDYFAKVEILSTVLRLLIVYLLVIGSFDKLILYAILVFAVFTFISILYVAYCLKHFKECRFQFTKEKSIIKPMLNFSGWNLYNDGASSARQQGGNMIVNMFLGVSYNAACGIAMMVSSTISGFSSNVLTAFRPQLIKSYAQKDISNMLKLISNASKYTLLLYITISFPLIFELQYIFELWLGNVPHKSVEICRLMILSEIPFTVNAIINIGIQATGKIKIYSALNGTILLLSLIPVYFSLKQGFGVESVYYVFLVMRVVTLFTSMIILKSVLPEFQTSSVFKPILVVAPIAAILATSIYFITTQLESSFVRVILSGIDSVVISSVITYFCVIDPETRIMVKNKIKSVIKSK